MTDETNPKDLEGDKKPPLSLVPPCAIVGMAMAFKEGARKYGAYNWRSKKVQAMIYIDAALRHIGQKLDGEDIDPESGVDHLDAAMASLAVYKDAQETGNLIDNRPVKGKVGTTIRKISEKQTIKKSNGSIMNQDYHPGDEFVARQIKQNVHSHNNLSEEVKDTLARQVKHVADAWACHTKQCKCDKFNRKESEGKNE